jgi:hypothetical protein
MRHFLLSPGLILSVSTGAFAEVPFTQPRSPGPYGWNLAQITMMQYASGATSPLGALIMKRLLLALVALFALFVVPAFAEVPYVQGCSTATTGWLTGNTTLTQYNSGAGPLGLATPNGAPYCVITNTSTVQTGWPGASMWFGDLPASNNDWVQSNGTGGPLPGYPGQFTQIVWAYVFVTGPNAWQAQPNQSMAAFIIDNNPNIQNAVNGVYGPNNGAPSYFESLFALSVPPGGGSVQVFYTTDYGYIPNPGLPLVATITQNGWYGFAATYSRDPTGTGAAILTQQVMDVNGNVLGSNTQSNANTPSQSLFGTDELTLNWQPGQTGFMGNVLAIIGSQSYLGPPVPLAPPAAGSITGTLIVPVAGSIINLTTQGSTDWAVWGYNGSTSLTPVDRKSIGGSKISALTSIGSGYNAYFNNSTFSLSWADGTPTASGAIDPNGIYVAGQNNGYSFTVPASTSPQTVYVHVGLYQTSAGKLTATLSDGSAPAYVDTSLGDTIDTSHGKEAYYAITYKANSPGQTLTVTWTNTTGGGNVTIQSVALGTSGSGSITGALTIPAAGSNISLTAQGTTDWAVWGYNGSTSLTPVDRKTTGGSKISTLTAMGSGYNGSFNNSTFSLSWSDGLPTASSVNDQNGIYVSGINNGYSFTVPAGTTPQTVYVHVGLYQTSAGKLTATLSDGSAPAYVDTSLGDTVDTSHGKEAYYSITYKAGSPGQSLMVTWTNTTSGGNVTIQGVALGTAALGSIVGALTIPAAGSNINLTAQGTTDWAVWGYGGSPNFTPVFRKSSGGSQIGAITAIGNGGYYDFGNSTFALSWTDGSPTTGVSSDTNGIYVPGVNNGYSFTVPATTSPQVVYVYLGLYQTTAGQLTATLSDGSAVPYVNTSLGDTVDTTHGQEAYYAITYYAASAGQTLSISWVNTTGNGNVTMQGVALAP